MLITSGLPIISSQPAVASSSACPTNLCVFDNGKMRFGNGGQGQTTYTVSQNSINSDTGLFNQPFYKSADGNWYKLTFSSFPLDLAVGSGTGGGNWTGNTVIDFSVNRPVISSIDYSGFIVTSNGGSSPNSWSKGYGVIIVTTTNTLNTQSIEVKQKYELGQTSQFVKITTTVKNTSATTVNNLNIWVGTRDDYVGGSDSPQKTRGNLNGAGGTFQRLTTATDKATALQITTVNEGALFYSTTLNTDMAFNNCCSFSNAYNQLPSESENGTVIAGIQSEFNDGSYAAILAGGSISAGASAEIVWFYAAGATADLDAVASAVSSAAAPAVPEAQRNDNSVVLNWVAPTTSETITNYAIRYSSDGGSTWTTITRSPASTSLTETITGLSNTLTYVFQVAAITTGGTPSVSTQGDWSGDSLSEILGSPNAPTSASATGGDRSAVITFTEATTNGTETATVTNYEYFTGSPDTWTALSPVDTSSPITIPNLQNGQNYTIQIRAVNSYGPGPSVSIENVRTLPAFTDDVLASTFDDVVAYTDSVTATSGVTYSRSGALPAGINFNTTTGRFSGTATELGSFTFTITATNTAGSISRTYTITSPGFEVSTPQIAPIDFPTFVNIPSFSANQFQPFTATIAAVRGDYYEVDGALPAGLSLNQITGVISGTPTVFGSFNLVIIARIRNGGGTAASFPLTISRFIRPVPTLDAITISNSEIGNPLVTINGEIVKALVQPNNTSNGIEVISEGWGMSISATQATGQAAPLTEVKTLVIKSNEKVYVGGKGFKPNSNVRIFIFSTAVELGTIITDKSGEFSGLLSITTKLTEGLHTIQANGMSPENDLRSVSIPALYSISRAVNPAGSSGTSALTLVIPFSLNQYTIGATQREIIMKVAVQKPASIRVIGYSQPSKKQADIALSLDRAIEVRKSLSKIIPNGKFTVRGLGPKSNPVCAPFKNKCVVIYINN